MSLFKAWFNCFKDYPKLVKQEVRPQEKIFNKLGVFIIVTYISIIIILTFPVWYYLHKKRFFGGLK